MIGQVTVYNTSDVSSRISDDFNDLHKMSFENIFMSDDALKQLRKITKCSQLQIFCSKPSGTIFHIVTNNNSSGFAVVDYMLKEVDQLPTACGSFTALEDDNSHLSKHCESWGKNKEFDDPGNHWSYKDITHRLINHLTYIYNLAHVQFTTNRKECDDYTKNGQPIGNWKYLVR